MPYVDTTIKEGSLITDLGELITNNGWEKKVSFDKIGYGSELIMPSGTIRDDTTVSLSIARHTIFANSKGVLYGVAKVYNFSLLYKDLTIKPRTDEPGFRTWLSKQFKEFGKECILYYYMCEKVPEVEEGGFYGCAVGVTPERGAIDIETYTSVATPITNGNYVLEYTKFDEDIQQSPFIKSTLRNPNLSKTDVATNWWPDSLVRVKGYIDPDYLFIVIQADNTPAFNDNVVPTVPVYWGQFESFKTADVGNYALWAGTAFDTGAESASHTFDQKSATPYRRVLDFMPVQKTYPNFPGNGIDNIIVKRSELGARYQAYYLSWNAAPELMPPDRVGNDGGQYPLSWTTEANDEYKYKFNPSMYSQKIHTSRAYLVHPDEGVRGYLPKMVILAPFGLVDEDKLKVRTDTCTDKFDIYRYFLTSAISPVSKRPGTVYTPAGIGIYEKSI